MTGIASHNIQLTPICLLHTEEIAEAVLANIFMMEFPASLSKYGQGLRGEGRSDNVDRDFLYL